LDRPIWIQYTSLNLYISKIRFNIVIQFMSWSYNKPLTFRFPEQNPYSFLISLFRATCITAPILLDLTIQCQVYIWQLSVYFLALDISTFKIFVLFTITLFTPKSDRTNV